MAMKKEVVSTEYTNIQETILRYILGNHKRSDKYFRHLLGFREIVRRCGKVWYLPSIVVFVVE